MWTLKDILVVAGLTRLLLVCYGRIQDYICDVKFTDIDYHVFSDAARYLYKGQSPYNRATYRYSPILAFLLVPTVSYAEFGKILFNLCDLAVGYVIFRLLKTRRKTKNETNDKEALFGTALWLFNPLTTVISSRGNAEVTNVKGFAYVTITFCSFGFGVAVSYLEFGMEYLNEALLYHLSRSDTRHNFSPYFYPLYLSTGTSWAQYVSIAAFVPQLITIVMFAFRYGRSHLEMAWFLTTFAFVSFNKVCTSQYFVWYLCLLPLILPDLSLSLKQCSRMSLAWFGAQGLWLLFAYLLEFRGWNVFIAVWLSSLVFLGVNCWIMHVMIRSLSAKETKDKHE